MSELGLPPFLVLSAFLFVCGVVCIATKRNAIGETNTSRPLSQPPVFTTRYRIVHCASSNKNSSTEPMSPSVA